MREVKIKAHAQLLESYKTIKLSYMADTFGVTEDYIDIVHSQVRLHAKIDKMGVSHL